MHMCVHDVLDTPMVTNLFIQNKMKACLEFLSIIMNCYYHLFFKILIVCVFMCVCVHVRVCTHVWRAQRKFVIVNSLLVCEFLHQIQVGRFADEQSQELGHCFNPLVSISLYKQPGILNDAKFVYVGFLDLSGIFLSCLEHP